MRQRTGAVKKTRIVIPDKNPVVTYAPSPHKEDSIQTVSHKPQCLTALSVLVAGLFAGFSLAGCQTAPVPERPQATPPVAVKSAPPVPPPSVPVVRQGDEIIVAGQWFHTGTRVITWLDPGGYDAYREERRVDRTAWAKPDSFSRSAAKPVPAKSYGVREIAITADQSRPVLRGNLADLQRTVDQFVLHYDGCGISRVCFAALQQRGLSVHFLLDLDGTVYQTLDLQERALHATIANDRSIGIEIANIGAYPLANSKALSEWYRHDAQGRAKIRVPRRVGDPHILTKKFSARPARDFLVHGNVQGLPLEQYDFTPEQYAALSKLTAVLCRVFPRLNCNYPRDRNGRLVTEQLPDDVLAQFHGVLGHYHIQANKQDPGPALQWDKLIDGARESMK